jgi:hypothetical protein
MHGQHHDSTQQQEKGIYARTQGIHEGKFQAKGELNARLKRPDRSISASAPWCRVVTLKTAR